MTSNKLNFMSPDQVYVLCSYFLGTDKIHNATYIDIYITRNFVQINKSYTLFIIRNG